MNEKMIGLGKTLFALKKKRKTLEDNLKNLNKDITKLETETLASVMEDGEVESFKIKGLGTVYMADELYVNVLADDREKLYEELRETGNEALIKDWVFPQTLAAFAREQIKLGKPLPSVMKTMFIPTAKTRKKTNAGSQS